MSPPLDRDAPAAGFKLRLVLDDNVSMLPATRIDHRMILDEDDHLGSWELEAEEPGTSYLRAVARHWRIVVLITLVALLAAGFTVARRSRSYQATANVLVSPISSGSQDLSTIGAVTASGDPARDIETAGALIDSPAKMLGHGWTRQKVQNDISVTPLGQSDVLAVTATATTPQLAKTLANDFTISSLAYRAAQVQANVRAELGALEARVAASRTSASALSSDLATRVDDLSAILASGRDPSLSASSPAQLPTSPTGAASWLILLLAFAGGLALASVAAVLLDRFTSRIRDEAEVREILQAPVLAGVPRMRIAGRSSPNPRMLSPDAREQFRLLREQLSLLPDASAIVVSSSDASDGKTTVATALAAAMAEVQRDVILLDLDLAKPDVAAVFGIPNPIDSRRLLDPLLPLEELLVSIPEHPGLRVLPTRVADLVTMEGVVERFPILLAEAKRLGQTVIIDAPPLTAVSSSIRLIQVCDAVLLAIRPRHTDRSRLLLARNVLSRVHAYLAGVVLIGQSIAKPPSAYGYGYGYQWQEQQPEDE
jgi:Mrp family chromosome partitioning ATPase/capsular polysaccharide biosynthesis protein